ncbi:MAG TPA: hypothetical protein VHI13_18805 [Candidatus Kapabacteria bacterium]|nr:hypothetical protein [Candidatus Kapabacteria bacterium]
MAASSDLFELITSLSKSEKRYFRIFASLHARDGSNKYLQLFDLIDAQREYNEEEVRARFQERFALRHFAEAKYYLYNAILRALHLYAADQSVDVQITTALHQAMILYDRNLFRQSEKMVARARELAIANERWHLAIDADMLEQRFAERGGASPERIGELLERIFHHDDLSRDRLEQWATYVRMIAQIRAFGQPRNNDQLAAFVGLLQGNPEPGRLNAATLTAAIYHLYSRAVLEQAAGNYRAAAELYREMLPMFGASAYWANCEQNSVLPVIANICLLSVKARDREMFNEYYPILLEQAERSPRSAYYEAYIGALTLKAEFHLALGEYGEALAAGMELQGAMDAARIPPGIARRARAAMLLMAIHFGLGNYSRCIELLNMVFAMKPEGLPPYHFGVARIYQLMIHVERGDDDLLEHLLRSAHRYFVAGSSGYRLEGIIIEFIKQTLRAGNRIGSPALLRDLLERIAPLLDDPFERSLLNWVDIVAWLRSRVYGIPYARERQKAIAAARHGAQAADA